MTKSSATSIDMDGLRNSVDIVAVIGAYVRLRKAGSVWKGLCPFHQEKTPSFTVCERRRTFRCFGCGMHGDVVKFIQEIHHISFTNAVKHLGWNSKKQASEFIKPELSGEQVMLEKLWDQMVQNPNTLNVRRFWQAIRTVKDLNRLRGRMATIARNDILFRRTLLGIYAPESVIKEAVDCEQQ